MSDEARRLLEAVRQGLRDVVLPKLGGEYDRSIVIAMMGILGDVAARLVEDEVWLEDSIRDLAEGAELWSRWLSASPSVASEIAALAAAARAAGHGTEARRSLLAAASVGVRALWADAELRGSAQHALADLRGRLARDLGRQLGRGRKATPV